MGSASGVFSAGTSAPQGACTQLLQCIEPFKDQLEAWFPLDLLTSHTGREQRLPLSLLAQNAHSAAGTRVLSKLAHASDALLHSLIPEPQATLHQPSHGPHNRIILVVRELEICPHLHLGAHLLHARVRALENLTQSLLVPQDRREMPRAEGPTIAARQKPHLVAPRGRAVTHNLQGCAVELRSIMEACQCDMLAGTEQGRQIRGARGHIFEGEELR
mmetsp:Transcript_54840/g.175850  ORF Transcript_54840/g.175850 Transcript_54840/m.175850 type:complete len:217 (+) Transcript_54840:418-1068(+)